MNIKCPKCHTSYVIDGITKEENKRSLRCSTCGHNWRQSLSPPKPTLTSRSLQHVVDQRHFPISQYTHQTLYKPHQGKERKTKDNSYSGIKIEYLSAPSVSQSKSDTSSKSTLSQCVFCRRSSRCNLHDLYSGRRH